MPTDKVIFDSLTQKSITPIKQKTKPSIDRTLAYQLLGEKTKDGEPRFTTKYIMRVLHCSSRAIRMLRKEMLDKGIVSKETVDMEKLDKAQRDFDTECKEVMGYSFIEWLKSKQKKGLTIFNFCQKVWAEVWDKPFLYDVKDRNKQVGDELARLFIKKFGDDAQRIRDRKTRIRRFFDFMGREDINNRHLTMTRSRDLKLTKEVPEICFTDFPVKLDLAIAEMNKALGSEAELVIKLKLCTQMRTGALERELWGIRCKETNHSYIIMQNEDEYAFKVTAKMNEIWVISWIPKEVRKDLFKLYQSRNKGDKLFKIDVNTVRKTWKSITSSVGLPPLSLHDLRKVSITWFYIMGLPLEEATRINVGWRDLNTARDSYLQFKQAIKKDQRVAYRNNIPQWFKEGLDQYLND